MEMNESLFARLERINVSEHIEKKNGLSYLSWAWAWSEFKKACPDAEYEIKHWDGKPYLFDEGVGYMVETRVTANGTAHEMWLPVMDFRNKAIMQANMMDINKTIMRCLVKNIAMFGLGMYIYAGEDLPTEDDPKEAALAMAALKKRLNEEKDPKACVDYIKKKYKKELEELNTAEIKEVMALMDKTK